MFMATHLYSRNGLWYFRARIPTHLVESYGRAIVSVSLHTRDPSEARSRARERRVELERGLQALERAGPKPDSEFRGSVLHLSDADIDAVCERYRAMMLAGDEVDRVAGLRPSQVELDIDIYEWTLPDMRKAYATGDLSNVKASLQHFLKKLELKVARQSPSYERLARRFQQAEIEVVEALLQRRHGIAVDVPLVATDVLTLDDVYKCWARQRVQDPKTARSFSQAFALFKSHCKAPTARMVHKADVVAFRDSVRARGDISAATLAKQLGFLRAAFQCAVNDSLLEANPFSGVKVVEDKKRTLDKSRVPFELAELQLIFSSPVFQYGYTPRKGLGASTFWLPLLALFTGARLEELAQLTSLDVRHDAVVGHYICIRASEETGQRVKTLSSNRDIPVHPTLVELGFTDYAARAKGSLFPTLKRDKYGKLGTVFSTWFGRYLDSIGITDPTRVFHSFRHAFIQRAKELAQVVPPEVREAMVGHWSAGQIQAVYGKALYPLAPMAAAIKHITWPGLDLSPLLASQPTS